MDRISKEARSKNMSSIRSQNTIPELVLRKKLFNLGIRYKIRSSLAGKPDIVISKNRVVVFVNGCFWHGHGCKLDHKPKSNSEFWKSKISNNKRRDKRVINELKTLGWKSVTVWECQIEKDTSIVATKIKSLISE